MSSREAVYELHPERIAVAHPLFAGAAYDAVFAEAVFEGRQAGRLFVDDPERPRGALLCRTFDYFLAGEPAPALRRFVAEAPAEAGVFAAFYGYVPMNGAWAAALIADHAGGLETIGRRSFVFDPARAERVRGWSAGLPAGFTAQLIDAALAERIDRDLHEHIGPFWGGYDRFAAGGFGVCALAGEEPASVAFAIAVGDREVNIGVGTGERFHRRGLATAVSLGCIEQALARNLVPTWDCDAENAPSGDLALRLGFTEGPSFVELAFPGRAQPEPTTGRWTGTSGTGFTAWQRLGAT